LKEEVYKNKDPKNNWDFSRYHYSGQYTRPDQEIQISPNWLSTKKYTYTAHQAQPISMSMNMTSISTGQRSSGMKMGNRHFST